MNVQSLWEEFYSFGSDFQIRQYPEEMQLICDFFKDRKFKNYVEIGNAEGGSLWVYAHLLCEPGATITTVDPVQMPQCAVIVDKLIEKGFKVDTIKQTSREAFWAVPKDIDLLHIDGSHEFEDVKGDFFQYYAKMKPGGVILLHDTDSGHFGPVKFRQEILDGSLYNHRLFSVRRPDQGDGCGCSAVFV